MTKYCLDCETTGFDSLKDRLLCIGIHSSSVSEPTIFYGEDEAEMLRKFFDAIKTSKEIITFNGNAFDIPFIIRRALINNVRLPANWHTIKFTDLRLMCNGFFHSYDKKVHGTLRDWATILLLEVKTDGGNMMEEWYKNNKWHEIIMHNAEDLIITLKLYERCINCGVIHETRKDI